MGTEATVDVPASGDSRSDGENKEVCTHESSLDECLETNETKLGHSECELQYNDRRTISGAAEQYDILVDSSSTQSHNSLDKEIMIYESNLGLEDGEIHPSKSHSFLGAALCNNIVNDSSKLQVRVEVEETVDVPERSYNTCSEVHAVEETVDVPERSYNTCSEVHAGKSLSGVKRVRMTFEEQQPSVHINYNCLTRASKSKLVELLQQWSDWHALHGSTSQDPAEETECGEDTYFPALRTALQNSCAVVPYSMDYPNRKQQKMGLISSDAKSVPLYDRGYAKVLSSSDCSTNLDRSLKLSDDPARCFNCGSYSHSLKECPKPRDNIAVNNARKQFISKRNQNASSRNPTRYFQSTPGGKFDFLRPGALDPETRKLLGIGELDPPPWLNRMREIGYPPGYLDLDDEDQSSGITIFDGEAKEEQEFGETLKVSSPKKKMIVEFPGVNAPIPENADKNRWNTVSSSFDSSRDHSHRRFNHSLDSSSRGQHSEQWSWDSKTDGHPGGEAVLTLSAYSYPPRYGDYFPSHLSCGLRDDISRARRPLPIMSSSYDTWQRNPLRYEEFVGHGSYDYGLPNRYNQHSRHESARYEQQFDERRAHHN